MIGGGETLDDLSNLQKRRLATKSALRPFALCLILFEFTTP